jgi:hypothetical protein
LKALAKLVVLIGMLALAATPSLADPPDQTDNPGATHRPAGTPPDNQGTQNKPDTPGPRAGMPAKAKANGRFCKGQSKKHSDAAEGTKGTPFSQCVTAMAKLATARTSDPARACASLSKKHAAGQVGTPYGKCVAAANRLESEAKAR